MEQTCVDLKTRHNNTPIRDWLKISWDLVYSGFNSSVMNGFIKNNLNVKTFLKNATTQ